MAGSVFPAASAGGAIKQVQRGLAGAAGTVTISAVNTAKSFVQVFGTTASGRGAITGQSDAGTMTMNQASQQMFYVRNDTAVGNSPFSQTVNAVAFSGGTSTITTAVVQGYLNSSTELIVSGACRWEVVEFN